MNKIDFGIFMLPFVAAVTYWNQWIELTYISYCDTVSVYKELVTTRNKTGSDTESPSEVFFFFSSLGHISFHFLSMNIESEWLWNNVGSSGIRSCKDPPSFFHMMLTETVISAWGKDCCVTSWVLGRKWEKLLFHAFIE